MSASLKVPFYKTFFRVTVPVCLPAILDIGRYLFVNAMVTISAVVFLYAPGHAAGVDRDPQHGRGRRNRPGGGDGDADRRDVDRDAASSTRVLTRFIVDPDAGMVAPDGRRERVDRTRRRNVP